MIKYIALLHHCKSLSAHIFYFSKLNNALCEISPGEYMEAVMYAPDNYDVTRTINKHLHYYLDGICINDVPASSLTVYFYQLGMYMYTEMIWVRDMEHSEKVLW